MKLLFVFLSLFLTDIDSSMVISDHTGEWEYSVVTPDYTYKGIMELSKEGDAFTGSIVSEGTEIELSDIKIEGDVLTFNMSVQGFVCEVKGTIEGKFFSGEVSVEGMAMPMKAKKID